MHIEPFNIRIMQPNAQNTSHLDAVKVLDTYDGAGHNFHNAGLFSVAIFGPLGSKQRDSTFAYIDLKVPILHPEVYNNISKLKALYSQILSGRTYVVWDAKEKDFVVSDSEAGSTGYAFFMRYFDELVFKQTGSPERAERIKLIEQYRSKAQMRRHLVLPAGLRDLVVKPNGHTTEDEINEHYRKLISISNTIGVIEDSASNSALNGPRWAMQRTANLIYDLLKNVISGKRGFLLGKWAARSVVMGTRNVISAMDTSAINLDSPDALGLQDTQVGFSQVLRGVLPRTIYGIKTGYLSKIITSVDEPVWLVDKKTLRPKLVKANPEALERYTTRPGLESLINRFFQKASRSRPLYLEGHYLGLIYVDNQYFKIFNDIDQLPERFSKENVFPLTLTDLLFVSTFRQYTKLAGLITRYPVAGTGSTYPTFFKVKTTTHVTIKTELGPDWEPLEDGMVYNFPSRDPNALWQESLSISPIRLKRLGADFDGDTCSANFTLTESSYDEITNYFKMKKAYVAPDGSMLTSINIDTVNLAVANMTGDAP